MSIIDQYKPCVCGSGKKFKFCKCGAVDHVPELEKILKLIEGEQDLAALDRINKTLEKLPNAAWLLAIKAGLLLRMQETRGLAEIAGRFLKLKPDNPLALIYRSIAACLEQESIHYQARYLLAGIAECRQVYPDVLGFAIELITERILNSEDAAMIGIWGAIQDRLLESDGYGSVMQGVDVHLYCKIPSKIIESSEDAPWIERLDEVNALTSSFRFEQAEKKLLSILRDFPNQPGPLSTLLRAQVALLDRQGALATAKKLAEHPELTPQDRAYFRVLAWEFDPTPLLSSGFIRYGAIESDEQLLVQLSAMPELKLDEREAYRNLMAQLVGDEVPAKRVFHIYHTGTVDGKELRSSAGILAIYGKQTDRPCRVFLSAFNYAPFVPLLEKIVSLFGEMEPIEPVPETSQKYIDFLCRDAFYTDDAHPFEDLSQQSRRRMEEFLNYPQTILDGKTPLEASADPANREKLMQLLVHLQGSSRVILSTAAIDEIIDRLGLPPRQHIAPERVGATESPVVSEPADVLNLDISQLTDQQLLEVLGIVITMGPTRLQWELATLALNRPEIIKEARNELTVRSILHGFLRDPRERLEHSARNVELLRSLNQQVGRAVMTHFTNLIGSGGEQNAQDYLLESVKKYPDDAELGILLQQLLARSQVAARASADAQMPLRPIEGEPGGADEAGSGLVLPGDAANPPKESKLWLPGS
jgi:hypothetical protein